MAVLLTGGAGFIGSHTAVELINAGEEVVIADDLSNSSESVIDRIEEITGKRPVFVKIDIADKEKLDKLFKEYSIEAAIHFAGFKAVGESVAKPIEYYRNNLDTTLSLLEVMRDNNCKRLIFSSSATVYGDNSVAPFAETAPTGNCTNPYGWTKYMIEQILMGVAKAAEDNSIVLLRYFNPIGAHESGLIGERPSGIPNNLLPYLTQTVIGIRESLAVYGNDYPTPDGTGVGYSVLDVINAFEEANNVKVNHHFAPRRPGDIATCYSDPSKAGAMLNWKAQKSLVDMCRDAWRWQQNCDK